MVERHLINPHRSSRRSVSAAPVERSDNMASTQPISSIVDDSSPYARSWKSDPTSRFLRATAEDGSQASSSGEESSHRSCTPASHGHHARVDQGTPRSHSSKFSRGSVSRPQNMSDPISGPDPRVFGPVQYNPLSYSEGYASQYYTPSPAYGYYPTYPAYPYPTYAPYSAYPVTPTATSANSSATARPGSYSQGYPTEGGYMPEPTFPVYDGGYGRPYHPAPYGPMQPHSHYQNPYSATENEGYAEHTHAQKGTVGADKKRKHTDHSRKSKSSSEKTDEEKRRDMKEAVLKKVEEDGVGVDPNYQQSANGSDERLTPVEYSRKAILTFRQMTEEEENRELMDAMRRRQEDYDAFPAWIKQQETNADKGKRKEGVEAFVDVVLQKSELSGKRTASQGPSGEPNKEAREHKTDDISCSQKTPDKRMRIVGEPTVDRPKVESTNPVDTRDKPRNLPRAAGRVLKAPPGLPYPPSNALLPRPSPCVRPPMAIQARLKEANNWFHAEDKRKGLPFQVNIEKIACDYSASQDSEQDRRTAKESTLLIGNVIANLLDYFDGRDAKGISDPFAMFRYVSSRYCDKAKTGRRSYFEIDPLINRRATQPRRSEKPEKLVLIRHRRPEL